MCPLSEDHLPFNSLTQLLLLVSDTLTTHHLICPCPSKRHHESDHRYRGARCKADHCLTVIDVWGYITGSSRRRTRAACSTVLSPSKVPCRPVTPRPLRPSSSDTILSTRTIKPPRLLRLPRRVGYQLPSAIQCLSHPPTLTRSLRSNAKSSNKTPRTSSNSAQITFNVALPVSVSKLC